MKNGKLCDVCQEAKGTKNPYGSPFKLKSKKPLEIVYSDVCGPFPVESITRARYFVTFIDDFTRYTVVVPLRSKSDVFDAFKTYVAQVRWNTSNRLV